MAGRAGAGSSPSPSSGQRHRPPRPGPPPPPRPHPPDPLRPTSCPPTNPVGTTPGYDPSAIPVAKSTQDVQVALPIKWNGGPPTRDPETVTFNAKLTDTGGSHVFASPAAVSLVTPCPTP